MLLLAEQAASSAQPHVGSGKKLVEAEGRLWLARPPADWLSSLGRVVRQCELCQCVGYLFADGCMKGHLMNSMATLTPTNEELRLSRSICRVKPV